MYNLDHADATSIRRLVVLPFGKSVQMAFQSLRVRLLRSMITTLSLALAISFYSFIQTGNLIGTGVLQSRDSVLIARLAAKGYDVEDAQNGAAAMKTSPKQRWILFLSLLVCVVGIVNAQLMAVTERFREIGTMKCLGALDRFVLRLFLLEAGMQGALGGVLGAAFGGVAAVVNSAISLRIWVVSYTRVSDMLATMGFAAFLGCVLSLAGVLYPALMAAHMQPVAAMRTEA